MFFPSNSRLWGDFWAKRTGRPIPAIRSSFGTAQAHQAFVLGFSRSTAVRPQKSPSYLRNAAVCRKLAKAAQSNDRATFLDLAQHWEAMADIEARIVATLEVLGPEGVARVVRPIDRGPLAWVKPCAA